MPRLLDEVRSQLRTLHDSNRTEQQYVFRVRRLVLFHGKRHLVEMGAPEIEALHTHRAVDRQVIVRNGKGVKGRSSILPDVLVAALQPHLATVRGRHECAHVANAVQSPRDR